MKRSIEEIRSNLDFVGCDNATAAEMCDEIERLRAELDHFRDCSYDATGDEIATLRRALCNAGIAGPESDETLGIEFVRYAKQVIRYVARQSRHVAAMP